MKAVITGVAAIGLAMTMPAFAQTPQNSPIGQYNQGSAAAPKGPVGQYDMGGAAAQKGPVGQYDMGGAAAQKGPIGQYNQGGASAKKTAAAKKKPMTQHTQN